MLRFNGVCEILKDFVEENQPYLPGKLNFGASNQMLYLEYSSYFVTEICISFQYDEILKDVFGFYIDIAYYDTDYTAEQIYYDGGGRDFCPFSAIQDKDGYYIVMYGKVNNPYENRFMLVPSSKYKEIRPFWDLFYNLEKETYIFQNFGIAFIKKIDEMSGIQYLFIDKKWKTNWLIGTVRHAIARSQNF